MTPRMRSMSPRYFIARRIRAMKRVPQARPTTAMIVAAEANAVGGSRKRSRIQLDIISPIDLPAGLVSHSGGRQRLRILIADLSRDRCLRTH